MPWLTGRFFKLLMKGLDFHPYNTGKFCKYHRVLNTIFLPTFKPLTAPNMFCMLNFTEILSTFMICNICIITAIGLKRYVEIVCRRYTLCVKVITCELGTLIKTRPSCQKHFIHK